MGGREQQRSNPLQKSECRLRELSLWKRSKGRARCVSDTHIKDARELIQRGRLSNRIRDQTDHAQYILETIARLEKQGDTPIRSTDIGVTDLEDPSTRSPIELGHYCPGFGAIRERNSRTTVEKNAGLSIFDACPASGITVDSTSVLVSSSASLLCMS